LMEMAKQLKSSEDAELIQQQSGNTGEIPGSKDQQTTGEEKEPEITKLIEYKKNKAKNKTKNKTDQVIDEKSGFEPF